MTEFDKLKQAADSDEVHDSARHQKLTLATVMGRTYCALGFHKSVVAENERKAFEGIDALARLMTNSDQASDFTVMAMIVYAFLMKNDIVTLGLDPEDPMMEQSPDMQTKCAILMNMVMYLVSREGELRKAGKL